MPLEELKYKGSSSLSWPLFQLVRVCFYVLFNIILRDEFGHFKLLAGILLFIFISCNAFKRECKHI